MKVGSMTKGKRILLMTAVMLLAANGVHAGLWKSRKTQAAADAKTAADSPPASNKVKARMDTKPRTAFTVTPQQDFCSLSSILVRQIHQLAGCGLASNIMRSNSQ